MKLLVKCICLLVIGLTFFVVTCEKADGQVIVAPIMQPAPPVMPQAMAVYPIQQFTTLRWGFFGRRLVPRTHYMLGSPQIYVPAQQAYQSAEQAPSPTPASK